MFLGFCAFFELVKMGRGSSFKKDIEQMTPSKEAIIEKDSEAAPEGWFFLLWFNSCNSIRLLL